MASVNTKMGGDRTIPALAIYRSSSVDSEGTSHFGGGARTDWSISLEQPPKCGMHPDSEEDFLPRRVCGRIAGLTKS